VIYFHCFDSFVLLVVLIDCRAPVAFRLSPPICGIAKTAAILAEVPPTSALSICLFWRDIQLRWIRARIDNMFERFVGPPQV